MGVPKLRLVREGEQQDDHALTARQIDLKTLLERRGYSAREAKAAAVFIGEVIELYDGFDGRAGDFFTDLEKIRENVEAMCERRALGITPLSVEVGDDV